MPDIVRLKHENKLYYTIKLKWFKGTLQMTMSVSLHLEKFPTKRLALLQLKGGVVVADELDYGLT